MKKKAKTLHNKVCCKSKLNSGLNFLTQVDSQNVTFVSYSVALILMIIMDFRYWESLTWI